MRAPGVRVRARRLRLLCPGRQSQTQHRLPWAEQVEILISHPGMLQSTRKIKAEVVGGSSHGGKLANSRRTGVAARGKDLREHLALLCHRNYIQPDAENVCVLAEVLLRRSIREQTVLRIPAARIHPFSRPVSSSPIHGSVMRIADSCFHFLRIAKRLDELQRDDRRFSIRFLRRLAKTKILAPIDERPPGNSAQQSIRAL